MTQTAHMEGDLRLEDVESSPLSSRTQITVSNPPSDGPAAHTGHITFYTFPATLPHSTLTTLAEIHPVLAAIASGGVISLALTVVTLIAIDPNQRLRRTKNTTPAEPSGTMNNSNAIAGFNKPVNLTTFNGKIDG